LPVVLYSRIETLGRPRWKEPFGSHFYNDWMGGGGGCKMEMFRAYKKKDNFFMLSRKKQAGETHV
jgi:hypothetical protein